MVNNTHKTGKYNSIYKKRFYNIIWSIPLVVLALFMLPSLQLELSEFVMITFVSVVILLFQLVYYYKKWKMDENQKR